MVNTLVCGTSIQGFDSLTPPHIEVYAHLCARQVKFVILGIMGFFLIIKVVNNKMNVSIEILEFPLCVKNKILRIKDITKLNIGYIAGKNIVFNNSNLELKEPYKIIISNGIDKLVLLCYDDTNLYNEELNAIVTLSELTNIVNMFLGKKL